jgi:hypothetical protein
MSAVLSFPGGALELVTPSPSQLTDSALAWLTLAQQQVGRVESLTEAGAEQTDLFREIATLRAQLRHTRTALTELSEQTK